MLQQRLGVWFLFKIQVTFDHYRLEEKRLTRLRRYVWSSAT